MTDAFAADLLEWYRRTERRRLPWQADRSPYRVWVSEVMLQQTRVGTVSAYFERFVARFPEPAVLAAAPLDEVLHLWSGLGYYARARNLHLAAGLIVKRHGGRFPEQFDAVAALPGIGRSTAGAILAQAFGQRHPILDGNVKRVLARRHAVAGWPGEARVEKRLWQLAEAHTPVEQVGDYTQAIMDLGATVCRRSRPACDACPVSEDCVALRLGRQAEFPAPRPHRKRPRRRSRMLLLRNGDGEVLLERRPPLGIWGGLWCPPELGNESPRAWGMRVFGLRIEPERPLAPLTHGFTHFELEIEALPARLAVEAEAVMEGGRWVWYNARSPAKLGLASVVRRLLEELTREATRASNRETI
jgi:A/G-specific adenine glycosylase